jgi:hypothetical protein
MRVFSVGFDGLPVSRAFRKFSRIGIAAVLAGSLLAGATAARPLAAGAASRPPLTPDAGQLVSVPVKDVMSTTALAAGNSLAVPVAGVGLGVPSNASFVVVVIKSVSATAPGYLSILQLLT